MNDTRVSHAGVKGPAGWFTSTTPELQDEEGRAWVNFSRHEEIMEDHVGAEESWTKISLWMLLQA